ncbi:MAG: hypothetical protein U0640_06890 [Phycisphaerales bacterium]
MKREDIPRGVEATCVFNEVKAVGKFGSDCPSHARVARSNMQKIAVRYVGPDGAGGKMRAELRLDNPSNGEWELWLVAVDEDGNETGLDEPLAWCRWPEGTDVQATRYLITIRQSAFQAKLTDTEVRAESIEREFIPVKDLLLNH